MKSNRPSNTYQLISRNHLYLLALLGALLWTSVTLAQEANPYQKAAQNGVRQMKKDRFDRLDGTGPSGVKVDVIDWAGNLEIHVYPKGSLHGLSMKIDRRKRTKSPVMVIGYRFSHDPQNEIIRRALLTMKINDSFKVFRDPKADGYDKIIVSNHVLADVAEYRLGPEPKHLYPKGHPLRPDEEEQSHAGADSGKSERQVAGQKKNHVPRVTYKSKKQVEKSLSDSPQDSTRPRSYTAPKKRPNSDGGGNIRHFSW